MSWLWFVGIILFAVGFVFSKLFMELCKVDVDNQENFKLYQESWLYLGGLSIVGMLGIFYFIPDMQDVIVPVRAYELPVICLLSVLIYFVFLFDVKWLYYATILLSSAVMVSFVPTDVSIFGGLTPWWAERLILVAVIAVWVLGLRNLNGLSGVFGINATAISAGVAIVAAVGGMPLYLGMMGLYLAGVWLGFLNLNWYPSKVFLNSGSCAAAAFLLAWILLKGTLELAGPSVVILMMFFITETLWMLCERYIFNIKKTDICEDSAYFSAFEKGLNVVVIGVSIVKINIVNVIFATFQLFAANSYSFPIFTFVVNLWLLGLLYRVESNNKTLKEINKEVIKNVKDGLQSVKDSITKNKE